MRVTSYLKLLLIALAAILVHGYHLFVEDAAIYVPGIKQELNPALYPYNRAFFASHARLTFFPNLVAGSVRLTHVRLEWALLIWHAACIFFLLLACWRIAALCFRDPRAPWGAVVLVAALLTIPIAGTALYMMDQYLNPRSLSTPAILFVFLEAAEHKFFRAALWLAFTALIHPLMVVFGAAFLCSYFLLGRKPEGKNRAVLLLLPLGLFPPVTDAYRNVLNSHSYFFVTRWEWYEWLGIFGPLALLWWFGRIAGKQGLPVLHRVCQSLIVFQLIFLLAGVVVSIPSLAGFAELQPMRSLHLLYILLFVIGGGFLARFVLKDRRWRWIVLFIPLCAAMWFAQRQLFPATEHLELPGRVPKNYWVQAFIWIRNNTPLDANFALNPDHMELPGEDQHGFRAIAERSMLADRIKDSGAVSMFPALAETWRQQVAAQQNWTNFRRNDFQRLKQDYAVNWIVDSAPTDGLVCPYRNAAVAVCRIEAVQ